MPKITDDSRDEVRLKLGERLREMQKEAPRELAQFLASLSEKEANEILYDQEIWARRNQWVDLADGIPITLLLAGRGYGKGYTGASTIKRAVQKHGVRSILIIAPTARDFRSNIAPSIINMYPPDDPDKPYWSPSKASIIWPESGAIGNCIPAEAGEDAVRGLNNELILCDEAAFYTNDIVTQALLTLRVEPSKMVVTTTPKAVPLVIELVERGIKDDGYVKLIKGRTTDNLDNLSEAFQETVISKYEGTTLGRQELEGELILTNPAALWQQDTIMRNTIPREKAPDFVEVCLGVDPAVLAKKSSTKGRSPDSTGIILSGVDHQGILYSMEGFTGSYSMEQWVNKVCRIYDRYSALYKFTIAIEINIIGKEAVEMAFTQAGRRDVIKHIRTEFASVSKIQRASPYSLLAEQDKIKYLEGDYLKGLTMELTTFTGEGTKSPNEFDAFIWSLSYLAPAKKSFTKSYELLI